MANSNAALQRISIHALRKESDHYALSVGQVHSTISIHALRKESDSEPPPYMASLS